MSLGGAQQSARMYCFFFFFSTPTCGDGDGQVNYWRTHLRVIKQDSLWALNLVHSCEY